MNPYDRPIQSLPISRRRLIMNTGLAAAAIAGLSSCTTYGSGPAAQPSEAAGSGDASAGGSADAPLTTKEADIPVGSGKVFPDAKAVITQPKKGEFKAFSAVCTHQGCLVETVTDTINCPCHGSKYSITDGSVVNPPAPQPLPEKTIKVSGDTLTVN
jgi:Rieske Fe-S protein